MSEKSGLVGVVQSSRCQLGRDAGSLVLFTSRGQRVALLRQAQEAGRRQEVMRFV